MLICIIGRSGSGKSVIQKELHNMYNVNPIIKYYTRPIRIGEVNNQSYHFLSNDEFDKIQNKFITIESFDTKKFGIWRCAIDKEDVLNAINSKELYSLIITPYEYPIIKEMCKNIKFFYIFADEKTLWNRTVNRKDNTPISEKERRFKSDCLEYRDMPTDDMIIIDNNGEYNIRGLAEQIIVRNYLSMK